MTRLKSPPIITSSHSKERIRSRRFWKKVGLSLFGAQMLTKVKILLSIFMSMIIYLASWSENFLILLNSIQTPALSLEKLLKKAVKPHSDVQRDSFSLVQWTSWRKKIPFFFILSQQKVCRLFRELERPLTFKEQITSSSFKVKVMIIKWRQKAKRVGGHKGSKTINT